MGLQNNPHTNIWKFISASVSKKVYASHYETYYVCCVSTYEKISDDW